ncbi:MAG: radical SAM protein [Acidimicrobiaceae bacterium]|nr:radical SAM protein [Acidimicrobiaceae bacterium]
MHTLGCPKNQVDSDKLAGLLAADGLSQAGADEQADLVIVNTCAFVEEARQESIDTILALAEAKSPEASLVVTGCLAQRYGAELAEAMPEIDHVAGFGAELTSEHGSPSTPHHSLAEHSPSEHGSPSTPHHSPSEHSPVEHSPAERSLAEHGLAERGPVGHGLAERGPVGHGLAEHSPSEHGPSGHGSPSTPHHSPSEHSPSGHGSRPMPVRIGRSRKRPALAAQSSQQVPDFDLLNLPRPSSPRPWAYVKIAEGCDRACGFCAIPSFRGPQRSRSMTQILDEVEQLEAAEIVLVAQDLAAYGRDQGRGERRIVTLVEAVSQRVPRTRLLYLYPSDLNDALIEAVCATGVPYFDLSLQHVSAPLLRRMRRWGDGERFLARIEAIRRREPDAAFRSNFIVGYPGETEADHDRLLQFVEQAQLDWCGFFAYSEEEGTHSAVLDGKVDPALRTQRLAELTELQDAITARRRDLLIGRSVEVLVDSPGVGRTHREAPEIDGVVHLPAELTVGGFARLTVTAAHGCDLEAASVATP